jgi:mono/diheme cytochrome c family protein
MRTRCWIVLVAAALSAAIGGARLRAQEPQRSVLDGVYTEAQANRGAAAYDTACAGCHRADLSGNSGPALREQRFAQQYAGRDLKTLFTKIATTMPRNAAGSLPDNVNLDIVAHVLKENGFPAGARDLTADGLEAIGVVPGRPKPPPPVGDFSYVEVVGCLTAGPQNTWMLTGASEPVTAVPSAPVPDAPIDKPRGTQTFHLLDAMAYAPDDHKGQTIYVRGLLIKIAGEPRMTISTLVAVSPTCRD